MASVAIGHRNALIKSVPHSTLQVIPTTEINPACRFCGPTANGDINWNYFDHAFWVANDKPLITYACFSPFSSSSCMKHRYYWFRDIPSGEICISLKPDPDSYLWSILYNSPISNRSQIVRNFNTLVPRVTWFPALNDVTDRKRQYQL